MDRSLRCCETFDHAQHSLAIMDYQVQNIKRIPNKEEKFSADKLFGFVLFLFVCFKHRRS